MLPPFLTLTYRLALLRFRTKKMRFMTVIIRFSFKYDIRKIYREKDKE